MQIYVVNVDAAPLFPAVESFLRAEGFRIAHLHVNGLFTASSLKSCYHGRPWGSIEEDAPFLIDVLLDRGFEVRIHEDGPQLVSQFLGERADFRQQQRDEVRLREITPALARASYGDILVSSSGPPGAGRFKAFGDPEATREFLRKEGEAIDRWQSQGGDRFTHVLYSQHHDFVYYLSRGTTPEQRAANTEETVRGLLEWLRHWRFDAAGSVFLLFGDHGDGVSRLTPPRDYLRWCAFKDNTGGGHDLGRSLVSGIDFFPTLLELIGAPADLTSGESAPFRAPIRRDRTYHSADVRLWDRNRPGGRGGVPMPTLDSPSSAEGPILNATAMRIVDWSASGEPESLVQATYYQPTRRYYYLTQTLDRNAPLYRSHGYDRGPSGNAYSEVLDPDARPGLRELLEDLSESLVAKFSWIENKDYQGPLDEGDLPPWMEL